MSHEWTIAKLVETVRRLSKKHYIAELGAAIAQQHCCGAIHKRAVAVREIVEGRTVWKGNVEVFEVLNHPKAKQAYAWAHPDRPKHDKSRFIAVLEIPPVKDARTAVQAYIMADSKPQS